uniref:GRF-type domain-containing protein n=1 Tax=Noccaea caerulescens TaxID=107243 RepID=A0A1J3DCW3_NOCCA
MEMSPGIPRKCQCGALTIVLESTTKQNPGRKFYRCGAIWGPNHVFKWLDEAHLEEFDVLAQNQSMIEKYLAEIKKDLADMKQDMSEIIEVIESLRSKF